MTTPGACVGIDVAKAELVVGVRPGGARWSVLNDAAGLERVIASEGSRPPWWCWRRRVATNERRWQCLAAAELSVEVVNPRQVRDFARATAAWRQMNHPEIT